MIISSPLFEAHLECDTKCWLRAHAERSTGNTYAEWARLKSASYCEDGREHLLATFPENSRAIAPLISKNAKGLTWRVATDVRLQTNYLESCLQAVEKMPSKRRAKPPQFIPFPICQQGRQERQAIACLRRACALRGHRMRSGLRQDHPRRPPRYVKGKTLFSDQYRAKRD
jgi:hypothetical protein